MADNKYYYIVTLDGNKGWAEFIEAGFLGEYMIKEHYMMGGNILLKKNILSASVFDENGFDKEGFDKDGYNKNFYDRRGFNIEGLHKNGTYFDDDGYNTERIDENGFDTEGFNENGLHKNGTYFDDDGYNINGEHKDFYIKTLKKKILGDPGCAKKYYEENLKYISKQDFNNIYDQRIRDIADEKKKDELIKNINKLFEEGLFEESDNIYLSNKEILKDYKNIKEESVIKHLDMLIEKDIDLALSFYIKEKKYFNNYDIINKISGKIHMKIEDLLNDYKFQDADNVYSKYEEYLNYETTSLKKKYIKRLFDDEYCDKLNEEKYDILANDSKYTLIKARAGTGKSTVLKYKTRLLYKGYHIDPLNILIFSFNKNTAEKMNTDIIGKDDDIDRIPYFDGAMTFHRFAGMVLGMNKDERENVVSDREGSGGGGKSQSEIVQDIMRNIFSADEVLVDRMYQYFKKEIDELEKGNMLINKLDYYEVIKNTIYEGKLTQETLNGEYVKSVGEKWIADFLFEHNIGYKYESSIYPNSKNDLKKTYNPDFLLTNFETINNKSSVMNNVSDSLSESVSTDLETGLRISISKGNSAPEKNKTIIEHWGIDLNDPKQQIPSWWTKTREEYRKEILWKRDFLDEKGFSLIETGVSMINYSSKTARTEFEISLKAKLEQVNIICKKLPLDQIINKLKDKWITKLTELSITYIKKAKQKGFSARNLFEKAQILSCSAKVKMFYKLVNEIYNKYEEYLIKNGLIDMEDVLQKSIYKLDQVKGKIEIKRKIGEKETRNVSLLDIKYLMVDEYQDCNRLFYEIIDRIRIYNKDIKIICVGDDRQLINGFAGSNIYYFKNFSSLFSNATTLLLRETFRCPNLICKLANDFYGEENGSYSNKKGGEVLGYSLDSSAYSFIENRDDNKDKYNEDTIFFPKTKMKQLDNKGNPIKDINDNYQYIKDEKGNWKYEYNRNMYNMKYARYIKIIFNIIKANPQSNVFILDRIKDFFGYEKNKIEKHLSNLLVDRYSTEFSKKDNHVLTKKEIEKIELHIKKRIDLMHIHKSKGLQANVVIILEIGTNKYPMIHPDNELNVIFGETIQDALDEEKRLFYVALTRTENKLYYVSEKEIFGDYGNFIIENWGSAD